MPDFIGGIFRGGGSTETSRVVNSTTLPPEMREYVAGAGTEGLQALQTARPRMTTPGAYEVQSPRGIAGLQPDQLAALNQTRNIAQQGNPLAAAGMDYATRAASGEYLGSNKFIDEMLANQSNQTLNDVAGQFAGFGRFGSGQHEGVAAREVQKANAPILAQNYEAERGRQENAVNMLPMLDSSRFTDARALGGVGDVFQEQQQAESDAAYQQQVNQAARQFERDVAIGNLGLGAGSNANVGGSSTTTTTQPSNPVGNVLGGLGYGAQVGDIFGYPGIGAAVGGLGGLFGR